MKNPGFKIGDRVSFGGDGETGTIVRLRMVSSDNPARGCVVRRDDGHGWDHGNIKNGWNVPWECLTLIMEGEMDID